MNIPRNRAISIEDSTKLPEHSGQKGLVANTISSSTETRIETATKPSLVIIDDDAQLARSLNRFCSRAIPCQIAENFEMAIALISRLAPDSIVFSDLHIWGDHLGTEIAEQTADFRKANNISFYLITGGMRSPSQIAKIDQLRSLQIIDALIEKPFQNEALIQIIKSKQAKAVSETKEATDPSHVLLIDDDVDTAEATQLMIQGEKDLPVDAVFNFQDAADKIGTLPDNAVIISDFHLDNAHTGADLANISLSHRRERNIRFYIMSALAAKTDSDTIEKLLASKTIDGFFQKPVMDIEKIFSKIWDAKK